MKIKFLGAAQTVTGSCFVIETDKVRFAIDCGMHQGSSQIEKRNWAIEPYDPKHLDFIVITHAHIDHTGLLPRMGHYGFSGPIYTTEPTKDLLGILLLDSAHIQETDASGKNKRMLRAGAKADAVALYTLEDAQAVLPKISAKPYGKFFSPAEGIQIQFQDAGHILGSAIVELFIEEKGKRLKLVFSGDIGRPNQLLMKDPTELADADYLFMESTYGNRNHKGESESIDELAQAIAYSYKNREKVIIPAFAVERTQEILYSLHLLSKDGRLPKDMPIYLDSPLAIKATEIFRRHSAHMDADMQALLEKGENPLKLPQLRFTSSTAESVRINETAEPAIVISASGMANAGRILHHLRHNLWRAGASVVFVGFQAQGTNGRKIVDGANRIRIFNEDIAIAAKIFTINGFSAHAGQTQLLDWLASFQNPKMGVYLVHGENSAQETLASLIREKFGLAVEIPEYLEEILLTPGEKTEVVRPAGQTTERINPAPIVARLREKFEAFDMATFQTLPTAEQEDLVDRLSRLVAAMDQLQKK